MKPPEKLPSLERLEEDIRRLRDKAAPTVSQKPPATGSAMRMGSDFVAGVLVGTGIGYMLDRWLATSPVLSIICFLLGAGAGFRNILRAAKVMAAEDDTNDDPSKNEP
jgi:ATP synthase protein I